MPAAKIIGVPSRKENRVAEVCERLLKSPAAMVMPDREVPGSRAMACAHPINKTCRRLKRFNSVSVLEIFDPYRSAIKNIRDHKKRLYPTKVGLLRLTSIHSPPNSPISPAGNEARIMHQTR